MTQCVFVLRPVQDSVDSFAQSEGGARLLYEYWGYAKLRAAQIGQGTSDGWPSRSEHVGEYDEVFEKQ